MKVIQWGLPILLLLISLLNFNTTQNLTLWMASILVTEYGQWFALFCLVLMAIFYPNRRAVIPLGLALLIYLIPTVQLYLHAPKWKSDLTEALPVVEKNSAIQNEKFPKFFRFFSLFRSSMKPQTLVYTHVGGESLSLDFFKSPRPHSPFLLIVHGGGWDSGDRTQFADMSQYFANAGYAVASIDYRLAPKYHWPAPKEDAFSAVQYLRAHADELGIDADQWVILGRSAGGQIAERVAYETPALPGLKGCVAFYSPADMNFAYRFGEENDILKSPSLLRTYLGGAPTVAQKNFDDASGIDFVTKNSVPTLLLHGPRDPLVWVKQSERLFAKLQEKQVKSVFIRVPWATHGFDFNLNGPGGQLATYSTIQFLEGVFHR